LANFAGGFPDSLRASRGEAIHLPPKTTSFKQWAERLQEYAQSAELQQEQDYWLAERRKPVARLPVDILGREHGGCGEHRISLT